MNSRTMQDKFMGRPLIDLPKTHVSDPKIEFSAVEKILYEAMEGKFAKELQEILEGQDEDDGKVEKCDQLAIKLVGDQEESAANEDPDNADEDAQKQDEKLKDMLIGITRLRQ